jgi:hypothetical protein
MAQESHKRELNRLVSEHNASLRSNIAKTFGDIGSAFVVAGSNVNLIVMQATLF